MAAVPFHKVRIVAVSVLAMVSLAVAKHFRQPNETNQINGSFFLTPPYWYV